MIIVNIYKGIMSISICGGVFCGLYQGHKIAKDNISNKKKLTTIECIGEAYCYGIIVLSGGFIGLIGGTLYGITSPIMVPYTIYNISVNLNDSNNINITDR